MVGHREVPELEIRKLPPSTLRNIDGGSPGGAGAEDPGAPTINAKKRRWRAPGRPPQGGSDPHPGSKRCVVNLYRHDTQKVILLIGSILSALSSVMAHDP
jgi:hypothetical protein